MMNYDSFIGEKRTKSEWFGFEPKDLNAFLFDFQSDIVAWACKKGRAAIFADTGLGKTIMQCAWARKQMRYPIDNPDFSLKENGDYKNHYVQADWETWQGARENITTESTTNAFLELRQLRKKPFESELLGTFQSYGQALKAQDAWRKDLPNACFRIDHVQRTVISISGEKP